MTQTLGPEIIQVFVILDNTITKAAFQFIFMLKLTCIGSWWYPLFILY